MQLSDLMAAAEHAAAARRECELLADALERLHQTAEPSLAVLSDLWDKAAMLNDMLSKLDNRQS